MQEALNTTLLVEAAKLLGWPIFVATLLLFSLIFRVWLKFQKEKQDKDRREHMSKWDSMISMQKSSIEQVINAHKAELDRMFKLHERNTSALELMSNSLTQINGKINIITSQKRDSLCTTKS